MDHRIGSLHVRYRVRAGSMDAALPSGLDRAIQADLADAMSARLAVLFGDDPSVIVVRELNTAVALGKQDLMLDSRAVGRICESSVNALRRTLVREDSADSLIRFADEAEFVGSFLLDLVEGRAWDHWYYGALQRYRRSDARGTIRAVLAESGVDAARVLAWLARRGKLDIVMGSMAPGEALALVDPRRSRAASDAADGADVLADAALRLLAAFGWPDLTTPRGVLIAGFLATRPAPAQWMDRRSLSAWVLAFIRFVVTSSTGALPPTAATLPDSVCKLLRDSLDWLDATWLSDELLALTKGANEVVPSASPAERPRLTARQNRILERLALRLHNGSIRMQLVESEAELNLRLIAAAAEDLTGDERLDRTLLAAFEEIVRGIATHAPSRSASAPRPSLSDEPTSADRLALVGSISSTSTVASEVLRRYGGAAADLFQALQATQSAHADPWQDTQTGGLFLLLRALIDTRLPWLAHEAGVPLPPLLGAIAIKLFDAKTPFDAATALWVGAESFDCASLDDASPGLNGLKVALLDLLTAQHVLCDADASDKIDADAGSLTAPLSCSSATDFAVSQVASLLAHAWSHWLRGVAHSSVSFLLANCLRRAARVHISDTQIAVDLDPAPLDVVLQMAGYFARIDTVRWLAKRSVTFSVRHAS